MMLESMCPTSLLDATYASVRDCPWAELATLGCMGESCHSAQSCKSEKGGYIVGVRSYIHICIPAYIHA